MQITLKQLLDKVASNPTIEQLQLRVELLEDIVEKLGYILGNTHSQEVQNSICSLGQEWYEQLEKICETKTSKNT